ncbi:hypothetical protein [Vibrio penaeicida]|nr:hypothetical protein [Vibrio penaeicida]
MNEFDYVYVSDESQVMVKRLLISAHIITFSQCSLATDAFFPLSCIP